ncbi:cyclic nucleotide-binding domain-containing protein [Stigmatella aurantiaca]|uniref:PKA regulatory subunit-like protein n=1 Tax=Stigmatella aurantiaca (strain DW4/3-1) TaxID=378806 RepID=Q09BB3_STIAD|nr:cyclic nucleotide-binding domain-containing protein [Stigmatella aurantiaca]ADO69084.1 cAMP-binding protein [Stigmatella aurantiaca DW4/3-1]EAU69031.1 PKA regulatory subunit-like protein [Stigmatella aurantiaca DW4/3-1]
MKDTLRQYKNRAAELFSQGNLEGALSEYQSVMESAPDDATSRQRVAELLQMLGRRQESLATYEVLATVWAKRGWVLRALALCKVILQIDPTHERTQQLLATLHAQLLETPSAQVAPPKPLEPRPAPLASPPSLGRTPRIPIFSQLSGSEFLSLIGDLELRVFATGETLVEQGQASSSMFAIVEGSVGLIRHLKSGGQRTVAFMGEGDLFGELALVTDGPSRSSVKALERTVVLELTSDRVAQLIRRTPSVGQMLQTFHRERLLSQTISTHALFRGLSREQKEAMTRDFQLCSVPVGKTLVEQGQPVDALYLLLNGHCQVVLDEDTERASPLPALEEGDVFGEISMLLNVPATVTVRADSRCTLLRLDREACERHLFHQPGLRELLTRLAAERLHRTSRAHFSAPQAGGGGGAPGP